MRSCYLVKYFTVRVDGSGFVSVCVNIRSECVQLLMVLRSFFHHLDIVCVVVVTSTHHKWWCMYTYYGSSGDAALPWLF